eukprot:2804795-Karenia_brevis.AAC.1
MVASRSKAAKGFAALQQAVPQVSTSSSTSTAKDRTSHQQAVPRVSKRSSTSSAKGSQRSSKNSAK